MSNYLNMEMTNPTLQETGNLKDDTDSIYYTDDHNNLSDIFYATSNLNRFYDLP